MAEPREYQIINADPSMVRDIVKFKVAVIVCTEYKGVFFGYVEQFPETIPDEIRLTSAKMCIYWSAETQGILGLAKKGSLTGCKITPEVPSILLNKVTAIMEVTKEAEKAWLEGNWA